MLKSLTLDRLINQIDFSQLVFPNLKTLFTLATNDEKASDLIEEGGQITSSAATNAHFHSSKSAQIVLGFVFGSAVFSQTYSLVGQSWMLVFMLVGLWLTGYFAAGWLIRSNLVPGLNGLKPSRRFPWLAICVVFGFLLIYFLPITVYPMPQHVEIIATGERNPLSQGTEVWLQSITAGDYESPAFMRSCQGNWKWHEKSLVSYADQQPSKVRCTVRSDDSFVIRVGTHPWSGKMRLVYGDYQIEEDLYSAESDSIEFAFEVPMSKMDQVIWWIFFTSIGMALGTLLAAVSLFLSQNPARPIAFGDRHVLPWYVYACIFIVIWFFFLLVFWPGFFSNDTYNQFKQIEMGQYNDWHPIFHTLLLRLATSISFTTTPAVVLQIISLGLLLGWGLSMFECLGTPRWLTLGSAFYLAVSPALGLTILSPWKDLAYSISITALALFILHFSRQSPTKRMGWVSIFVLTMTSFFVAIFRHNGPPVAAGTLVFLMLSDRYRWKTYLWVLGCTFLIWGFIRGPAYSMLPISSGTNRESGENLVPLSEAVYLSRLHLRSGTSIDEEDERLLTDLTTEQGKLDTILLRKNSDRVLRLAVKATLDQPSVTVRYFMRKASFVFQILRPPGFRFGYVGMGFVANPYGIKLESKIPQLVAPLSRFKVMTENPEIDWFIWRNAFWMYLLLLGGVTASIRMKNWMYFGSTLPAILNALPYSLVASPQGRYILPTIILGPLFGLCLLFVRTPKRGIDGDHSLSNKENLIEGNYNKTD